MIVFKVKRMSRFGFRFYEGVDVSTSNCRNPTAASEIMERLKRWQTEGSAVPSHARRADVKYPRSSRAPGMWESETGVSDLEDSDSCSESSIEYSSDEYSEDELSDNNSVRFADLEEEEEEFVDIDLSESLEEFMLDQCSLANGYMLNEERQKGLQTHGVGILRDVIVNGSFSHRIPALQAIRLLGHCYLKGYGVEKDKEIHKRLTECADYLQPTQRNHVWNSIAEEFRLIPQEEEPEKRLLQICLLHWLKDLKDLKGPHEKSERLAKDYVRNVMYWSLWGKEVKKGFVGAIIVLKYLMSQAGTEQKLVPTSEGMHDAILIPSAPTLYLADLKNGSGTLLRGGKIKHSNTAELSPREIVMPVPEASLFSGSIRDSGPGGYVSEVDMNGTRIHLL